MWRIEDLFCDQCLRPAESGAIDTKETTKPDGRDRTYEIYGEKKFGCYLHPAESFTINLAGERLSDKQYRKSLR